MGFKLATTMCSFLYILSFFLKFRNENCLQVVDINEHSHTSYVTVAPRQNDDSNKVLLYTVLPELACSSLQKCSIQTICAEDVVNGKFSHFDNVCSLLETNCNAKSKRY